MSNHGRGECACCERKYAALRIAGTIDGVHMRQRDAYRDILTDLIAELRDEHGKRPHPLVGGSDMCQSCGVTFTVNGYCPTWHITDRAEARLKGLNDE